MFIRCVKWCLCLLLAQLFQSFYWKLSETSVLTGFRRVRKGSVPVVLPRSMNVTPRAWNLMWTFSLFHQGTDVSAGVCHHSQLQMSRTRSQNPGALRVTVNRSAENVACVCICLRAHVVIRRPRGPCVSTCIYSAGRLERDLKNWSRGETLCVIWVWFRQWQLPTRSQRLTS